MSTEERPWFNLGKLPADGEIVEVQGSDFMGDWESKAKFKKLEKGRYKFVGEGWMGTRPRTLSKGDVEKWRPLKEKL